MKTIISLFLFYLSVCKDIKYKHKNSEKNLYFVFTTFRHGARSTFLPIDSFGNIKLSFGELSNYGALQNLEIGKKYRKRYSNFLNLNYDKNQMYIRTSDVERTLESINKQLEGIFNKQIDQKDFIIVNNGFNFLNLYHLSKEEKEEMDKYSNYCSKRKLEDIDYRKIFKTEISPILRECYGTLFTLSLHIFCESVFSSYFEYTYGNDTTNRIGKCGKENAQKFYDFCFNWYNSFRGWDEYGAYMFYKLYQHLFDYMNKAIDGEGPVKMVMIGGHDVSLDKFMNFLDGLKIIPRNQYPHFAFNIVIELRKYNNKFYIEFYYNDTLKYNNTLKKFQDILNKSNYSNLYNYCGIPPWKQTQNYTFKNKENKTDNNSEEYHDDHNNNKLIKNETFKEEIIEDNNNENISEEIVSELITNRTTNNSESDLISKNILNETLNKNETSIALVHSNKFKKFVKKYFLLFILIIVFIIVFAIIIFYFYKKKNKEQFKVLVEEKKSNSNKNNISVDSNGF